MPTEPAYRAAGALVFFSAVLITGCGSPGMPAPPTPADSRSTTDITATSSPVTVTSSATPVIDRYAGMPLIDHLEWTTNVDGRRLLVYPTRAGRDTTFPGSDLRAWQEIRTRDPAADGPGMWDQFRCHWEWARLIAPDKPTWNLEPWRPPVGYDATVDAACNPGGPER